MPPFCEKWGSYPTVFVYFSHNTTGTEKHFINHKARNNFLPKNYKQIYNKIPAWDNKCKRQCNGTKKATNKKTYFSWFDQGRLKSGALCTSLLFFNDKRYPIRKALDLNPQRCLEDKYTWDAIVGMCPKVHSACQQPCFWQLHTFWRQSEL